MNDDGSFILVFIPPTHSFSIMAELTPNCIGKTISEASLTDAVVQVWVQGYLNCR